MGFYPPDALVHEAQRRGIEVLAPDVNESEAECEIEPTGRVRIGLGYVRGVREQEVEELVAARRSGRALPQPLRPRLAGRRGRALARAARVVGGVRLARRWTRLRSELRQPARAASPCGSSGWRPRGETCPAGPSWRCRSTCRRRPSCESSAEWESMLADYGTTGLTTQLASARAAARPAAGRCRRRAGTSRRSTHGTRVRVGGLVVARQRPGTANGIVFILLEDEYGTINLIVPPPVYERHRLTVRTEPLMLVEGKLERLRRGGRRDQRAGRPGRLDRRSRPAARRGQGLLDARRAGAAGLAEQKALQRQPKPRTSAPSRRR